jgi:GNAT superfamily N-acetyltransferase
MNNVTFEQVGQDEDYREYIRLLRNYYKDYFIDNTEINTDTHKTFMDNYGNDYYILTLKVPPYSINNISQNGLFLGTETNLLIGFIGVVNNDVRLAVHPLFIGQGYAKMMLKFIVEKYPNCKSKVKKNNANNLLLFEKSEYFIEYDECPEFFYFKSRGLENEI